MSKPAAFYGSFVDAKFMRGLKVMRVFVDIPIEKSNEFLQAFGAPDGANPAPCAIARLNGAPVPEKAEPAAEPERSTGGAVARTYTNSQRAALKCRDRDFQKWIGDLCFKTLGKQTCGGDPYDAADQNLKDVLGIYSKTELDGDKSPQWFALLTDFDMRNIVR